MRKRGFLFVPLLFLAGCRLTAPAPSDVIAADQAAMPTNTLSLSEMMRTLSEQPGFTEKLLDTLNSGKTADSFLTPELFDLLRKMVLGKDWGGLDRFPGWTSQRITRSVDLIGKVKSSDSNDSNDSNDAPAANVAAAKAINLDKPADADPFVNTQKELGEGVVYGDGPDPELAPLHAESERLAVALNQLSLQDAAHPSPAVVYNGKPVSTPQDLVQALMATGHTVVVADARYFANFGHLHFKGQDVEMPFWMDTQWLVPTDHWWQRSRHLLVPVAHAEYEWIIHGPKVNADVTYYFGIDGKAEFRTNDWLNQPWVMGRHAHEYRDAQALEVTRLVGQFVRAYSVLHTKHSDLPFGGYYALGVCQDSVGAIELRMTGKTTLFPNTANTSYFHDQPDAEITKLMEAVPKDTGDAPDADRIFGSLPTEDYSKLTIPGLRNDVQRSYAAWQQGKLHHTSRRRRVPIAIFGALLATLFVVLLVQRRKQSS